jgi:streptomycin 6-kinase
MFFMLIRMKNMDQPVKEELFKNAKRLMNEWALSRDAKNDAYFFTHSSLLWPLQDEAGRAVMLKIPNPDDDEAEAAKMLKAFQGQGAVQVLRDDGAAQLLERIDEGGEENTLAYMALNGLDGKALHILCDIADQLHKIIPKEAKQLAPVPFSDRFDSMMRYVAEGRTKPEDKPKFQYVYDMYREFERDLLGSFRPLHSDIHHYNVLNAGALNDPQRPWLAIDPKGIYGPLLYEYASMMVNPFEQKDFVADKGRMDRRARIIAERVEGETSINKDVILKLTFAHAMQANAWSLDPKVEDFTLACAETAAKLAKLNCF